MGEVAESREGVETVVDWPAAAGVDIVLFGVVEGVAEGDAEVVVRAVEVWLGVKLTDSNEVTVVG